MKLVNPAFWGAYRKGRLAFEKYGESAKCPYPDHRAGVYAHIVTFSRAFQRYWYEGLEDAKDSLPERYSPKYRRSPFYEV